MIRFNEQGYTPNNLRQAIHALGFTQQEMADDLHVSLKTVQCWLMPIGTKSRSDMPLKQWLRVLEILSE